MAGLASTTCLLGALSPVRSLDVAPRAPRSEFSAVPPGEASPERPRARVDAFFGEPDAPVRGALTSGRIARIDNGRGGRSIAFRITLSNGQRGYFKPEQTFSSSNWFGEVAAYHLDRALGLGRVPVAVSRVFPFAEIEATAQADERMAEMIVRDGQVAGAFVAWVTGELLPLESREGWESWLRVEHWATTAVNPFQRQVGWVKDLRAFRAQGEGWRSSEERARLRELKPEPDRVERPAELSDLIVFDYLTRNLDRWGGNNANVLVRGEGGPLVFLDNGAGFVANVARPTLADARLRVLQRFRRSTIEAVRAFDRARYETRLAAEQVQPVLRRSQLDGLEQRRKVLLAHVAELEAKHGDAVWAWE
jgi:hypothetical protein